VNSAEMVTADVGEAEGQSGPPPPCTASDRCFPSPPLHPGLTITKTAQNQGNLEYTQSKDIEIPSGAVTGKVTRINR